MARVPSSRHLGGEGGMGRGWPRSWRGKGKRIGGFRGHLRFSIALGILDIYNSFRRKMHIGFSSTLDHWKL